MPRVILIVAIVMLTIYAVVEVAQSKPAQIRTFPKWLWAFAVIAVPVVGPIGWLIYGRPASPKKQLPPRAPDDDEDFLRGL